MAKQVQYNVQKFGKALSRMVMPNIGAFIAWGFITALFISSGWWPNEKLATLVDPLLKYLLPLLIAITGGRNLAGDRGGIIAAIAAMGVIVGSDIPMFIGAMVIGPLSALLIKKFDRLTTGKIPAGFEMLVNNFSVGILGMICAIFGFFAIGPVVVMLTGFLGDAVSLVMDKGLLPLVSLFIEPGKVLFLNNAINHGILTPLGIEQIRNSGYSIMFLLEANPGSGLGVLMAYWLFSKGMMKNSAPGAVIIHFLGGIHEIYFPYILAKPALILAPILGSASAILVYSLFGGGLVAPASPGSIISVMAMAPRGHQLVVLLGVAVAACVSFLVASPIIKRSVRKERNETHDDAASEKPVALRKEKISRIVFACDAGMGSSAMGATRFNSRIQKLHPDIRVSYSQIDEIPADADVVVCQGKLAERARRSAPKAELLIITDFLKDPNLDVLFDRIRQSELQKVPLPENEIPGKSPDVRVLRLENILTGLESVPKEAAIVRAGRLLEESGYAARGYADSMLQRETLTSTCIGMGLAIPHGTNDAKGSIINTGMVVLQYPQGIDWDDEKAFLVIGIAAAGDDHLEVLARISTSLDDEKLLQELFTTNNNKLIYNTLVSANASVDNPE